jgi:hypothetical protein
LCNEFAQPLKTKNGRGSPTPMKMNDPPASRMVGDQIDFPG